jgi:hypothetical protein
MNKKHMVTITVSYPRYTKEISTSISDEATWMEVMDNVVAMLNMPDGYHITGEKLIEWAEETEAVKEDKDYDSIC